MAQKDEVVGESWRLWGPQWGPRRRKRGLGLHQRRHFAAALSRWTRGLLLLLLLLAVVV
jgi:hypothetical protein